MAEPLYVSILWHMHQPCYRDPLTGEYTLPWAYLHCIKDYYDMAAIVARAEGARPVFNFAPSLLEQIQDYADGTAIDPFLVLGRMPPADMGEEQRRFLLEHFFSANRQRMIEPSRRYRELLLMAGEGKHDLRERVNQFSHQDLLDLQVWFFLSWTGEAARREHPPIRELIRKGRNFSSGDKELLFQVHGEILKEIIPLYRKLQDTGRAELSASPWFHPILPLLCDTESALGALPEAVLPGTRFRHPEDARNQVRMGMHLFRRRFGRYPSGMWPSEGSVSDDALAVMAETGLKWTASDEEVLSRTLGGLGPGRELLYAPHRFRHGEREMALFFRDHVLSDLIGFTYSRWQSQRAVTDFVTRLQEIRKNSPAARVVPVILDGENAWEHYENNGFDFLTGLYRALAETPGLEPATFSDVLETVEPARSLERVHPGSWIDAHYGIWIGQPEKNVGWEHLARAREVAARTNPVVAGLLSRAADDFPAGDDVGAKICRSLYAAEGSDWFWWYGDDHFSLHSDRFDHLFRSHLMHVYRLLGLDIPAELLQPVKKKGEAEPVGQSAGPVAPRVDGSMDDSSGWLGAGFYDLARHRSAMHAAENLLQSFFFGFDRTCFHFRIDGVGSLDRSLQETDLLTLWLVHGEEYRVAMSIPAAEGPLEKRTRSGWEGTGFICRWRIRRICELAVPKAGLAPAPGIPFFGYLTLSRAGNELGRWPEGAPMALHYAAPDMEPG